MQIGVRLERFSCFLQGENEQSFEVNEEEQTGLINPPIKQAEDEDEEQNSINYYFIIG